MRARRNRGDSGMATVTVIGLGTVLCAAGVLGVLLGGVASARHRAGAAADFAAIAAAEHWYDGPAAACRAAAALAAANGAALDGCMLRGSEAEVRVSVPVGGPFARLGPARATARAAPVGANESAPVGADQSRAGGPA